MVNFTGVCNKGRLYIKINGTGRLYEAAISGDSLRITRVDSTFYLGDCFHAFNFSSQNSIYSFGGYGFWRNNGMIREYDTINHEWEVKVTDRVVRPMHNSFAWLDNQHNILYAANDWLVEKNLVGGHQQSVSDHVFSLDLKSGKWKDLGSTGRTFGHPDLPCIHLGWGWLSMADSYKIELYNPAANSVFVATSRGMAKLKKIYGRSLPELYYFVDSTLYFGNVTSPLFDSVQLSVNDFTRSGKMYSIEAPGGKRYLYPALFTLLIFGAGTFASLKYRNRKAPGLAKTEKQPLQDGQTITGSFNETEKSLIRFMVNKTGVGERATIDDINHVLGVTNKTEAVQKKTRSEVINSINEKWCLTRGTASMLIDRRRSDFDKRSYDYFMTIDLATQAKELITLEKKVD